VDNRKVVDLVLLYDFRKRHMVFFSTVRARTPPNVPLPEDARGPRPRASPDRSRAQGASTAPRRGAVRVPCVQQTSGPSAAPPVRALAKGAVVRRNLRRHPVVTGGREIYLRPPFPPLHTIPAADRHCHRRR
jgi:hypothetical protein